MELGVCEAVVVGRGWKLRSCSLAGSQMRGLSLIETLIQRQLPIGNDNTTTVRV